MPESGRSRCRHSNTHPPRDLHVKKCVGWGAQPEPHAVSTPQCAGIKAFVVNLVIQRSSNEELFRSDKIFMNKINMVLVQIVKQARRRRKGRKRCRRVLSLRPPLPHQEWPHAWPSFISDIVAASKTNESLCENNMAVRVAAALLGTCTPLTPAAHSSRPATRAHRSSSFSPRRCSTSPATR